MKKKSLYARCEVARAMVQDRRAFAPRESASTTINRDEPPHDIDRLGVVVALHLVR